MDVTVPCVRCGKPAAEHREHDEPHEHPRVPLCPACHRDLHDDCFRIRVDSSQANVAVCISPEGEVLAVRAVRPQPFVHRFEPPEIELRELAEALVLTDDESIAYVWECGARWRGTGDLVMAVAAWAYRKRYASFGESWYARAAELIREATGLHVSVGAVYQAAAIGTALEAAGWRLDILDLGKTVLAEAGKAPDPQAALEIARSLRDDGFLASEVVARLRAERKGAEGDEEDGRDEEVPGLELPGPETNCAHVWSCIRCGALQEEQA